jgi:hypothetical protein
MDEQYKQRYLLIANGTRKIGATGPLYLEWVARTLNEFSYLLLVCSCGLNCIESVVITNTIPTQHVWSLKAKVMPVTIGSTGTISKYKMFITGHSITRTINCNYRIAVTLCVLETWFVSGM